MRGRLSKVCDDPCKKTLLVGGGGKDSLTAIPCHTANKAGFTLVEIWAVLRAGLKMLRMLK